MPIPSFLKIRTTDSDLSSVQDNVSSFARNILNSPILDCKLIEDLELTGDDTLFALTGRYTNTVYHGLGRRLRGYIVVKSNGFNVTFSDTQEQNLKQDETLLLRATMACRISLLVF